MAWGLGLLNGLRISMKNFLRGPITVRYPYEKVVLPERSRWAVTPLFDPEGAPMCTGCTNCVRACPDRVLKMDLTVAEDKSKHIDLYTWEKGACMFCGLCVEACNFDALKMGEDYELAEFDFADLTVTLLEDVPARRPARDAKPAAAKPAADKAADAKTEKPADRPAAEKPADKPAGDEPAADEPGEAGE